MSPAADSTDWKGERRPDLSAPITPSHPFNRTPPGGDTNIFLNGRELNRAGATFCRAILGEGFGQGRWWLTGMAWWEWKATARHWPP